jgi:aminoglycoside phosphotransferase family enzyme
MANDPDDHASDVEVSPADDLTAAKLRFLGQPGSYPDKPSEVRVVETHYAWVFMTGRFVYKFKKPVRLGAVDFTSLAARKRICDLEFRLNRRLAAQTYLGVIPLMLDDNGHLQIGGAGMPVEWLIKMRELQRERMMDTAIRTGTIAKTDIAALVRKLAQFYAEAPISQETGPQFRDRLEAQLVQARDELLRPEFSLNARLVRKLGAEQLEFLDQNAAIFDARVDQHRIREVHGDLKPEHVCLGPDPQIIDRLEFKRALRVMDCVEEITFLAMECAALGGRQVARQLLIQYRDMARDDPPAELVGFYLSQRAAVRAMLAAWHLHDAAVVNGDYWRRTAGRYVRKALHYLRRPAGF